uniref:signal recognition particle receptor subunit alpha n=1 Tax=Trichloromonas sp. TaxID=3069249 RepID=UPI003D813EA0
MEDVSKMLNEYFALLVNWVSQLLKSVAALLGEYGVPEAYREIGALGVFYLLVTLAVALFILLLLRLGRKGKRPAEARPAPPEGGEAPTVAEEAPAPVSAVPAAAEMAEVREEAPPSLFERMRAGLSKTQNALVGRIDALLRGSGKIDGDLLEGLEEILITADFGMQTTQDLIQSLEQRVARENLSVEALRSALQDEIRQ